MVFSSRRKRTQSSLRLNKTHFLMFLHIKIRMLKLILSKPAFYKRNKRGVTFFPDIPEVAVVWTGATVGNCTIPDGFYLYNLAMLLTSQSLFPFRLLCNMKNEWIWMWSLWQNVIWGGKKRARVCIMPDMSARLELIPADSLTADILIYSCLTNVDILESIQKRDYPV